ncbi:MAG: hypothetical protein C5B51_11315 [Terriglobia bacterium]|nr:MAG: hypothetical protein C5B51_11315 [Terriglobia bacterium]
MKRAVLLLYAAGMLPAFGAGIRPRDSAADYPAHESAGGVTVGAAVIPPAQVRKLFATDLNAGGYIVLEVAVYSDARKEIDLSPGDFLLRSTAGAETARAASGSAIAAALQSKNAPQPGKSRDVSVYPTATVGYESGGYDPVTGQRRRGVYTGVGVGVGVGQPQPPGPAGTDRDRTTMQQELEDKSLPAGKTTSAVAGYLYFPKPSGKARDVYELTYYGNTGQVRLRVPAPAK